MCSYPEDQQKEPSLINLHPSDRSLHLSPDHLVKFCASTYKHRNTVIPSCCTHATWFAELEKFTNTICTQQFVRQNPNQCNQLSANKKTESICVYFSLTIKASGKWKDGLEKKVGMVTLEELLRWEKDNKFVLLSINIAFMAERQEESLPLWKLAIVKKLQFKLQYNPGRKSWQ